MWNNFKDWKTTAFGIATALIMLLVATGKITAEQQTSILEWIGQLIGIIAGVILMFVKDPKAE